VAPEVKTAGSAPKGSGSGVKYLLAGGLLLGGGYLYKTAKLNRESLPASVPAAVKQLLPAKNTANINQVQEQKLLKELQSAAGELSHLEHLDEAPTKKDSSSPSSSTPPPAAVSLCPVIHIPPPASAATPAPTSTKKEQDDEQEEAAKAGEDLLSPELATSVRNVIDQVVQQGSEIAAHIVHDNSINPDTPEIKTSDLAQALEQLAVVRRQLEHVSTTHNAALQQAVEQLQTEYREALMMVRSQLNELLVHQHGQWRNEVNNLVEVINSLQYQNQVLSDASAEQHAARCATLKELDIQVQAFDKVFSWQSEYEAAIHKVQQLVLSVKNGERLMDEQRSLSSVWSRLAKLAETDEFVKAVMSSVPGKTVEAGVPTLSQLQSRFDIVEKASRQAAYVPSATPSIWGHMVARAFAAVTFSERALVPGFDDQSRIARAGYFLEQGELSAAVTELEQLSELPRSTCADFVEVARRRLLVQQALSALRAHAAAMELMYY